jgi:hypothetical protein
MDEFGDRPEFADIGEPVQDDFLIESHSTGVSTNLRQTY